MAIEEGISVRFDGDASPLRKSLAELNKDLGVFKKALNDAGSVDALKLATKGIRETEAAMSRLRQAAAGSALGSNQAGAALVNLGRIAQDAPFGFIAIQNNLNPLLESFQRLKVVSGSSGAALKALGTSLIGAGGIGIALSIGSSLWLKYGDSITAAFSIAEKGISRSRIISETLKDAAKAVGNDIVKLEVYKVKLNDLNLSTGERIKVAKEYNKIADEGNKIDLTQIGNLGLLNAQIEKQNDLIIKRAISTAALNKITEASSKLIDNEVKLTEQLGKMGFDSLATYEKAMQKASDAKMNFLATHPEEKAGLSTIQKGLDGIALPAIQAAKGVLVADSNLQGLISTVRKGRADLDKLAGNLRGLITVPGLTTKPPPPPKPVKPESFFAPFTPEVLDRIGFSQGFIQKQIEDQLSGIKIKPHGEFVWTDIDWKKGFIKLIQAGDMRAEIEKLGATIGPGFADAFGKIFQDALDKEGPANLKGFFESAFVSAQLATQGVLGIADAFGALTGAIIDGKNGMQSFGESLKNTFKQVAVQLVKTIVLALILSAITGGASAAGGKGLSFLGAFKKLLGIPGAAGGMWNVPKDDYLVRTHKGEMIIPSSIAESLRSGRFTNNLSGGNTTSPQFSGIGQAGISFPEYLPVHHINGDEIVLLYKKASGQQSKFR